MLSIIIPTYNYVCLGLVTDLARQCQALKKEDKTAFDYEIIVADDASDNLETIKGNRPINDIEGCTFVEREKNVGRAYIRNWMLDRTRFDYVLLIDSDAEVCTDDFIRKYWDTRNDATAICGSLRNPDIPCPRGYELRYRYERAAELKREKRDPNTDPYYRLATFNVLLNKKAINGLRFDMRCQEYGYEDTLFGLTLQELGYTIKYIKNPLIHNGIDTNDSFLEKTEAALRTLSKLNGLMQKYAGSSHMHDNLKRHHLLGLFKWWFKVFRPLIRHNLLGRHPQLFLFNVYKLGYYSELIP